MIVDTLSSLLSVGRYKYGVRPWYAPCRCACGLCQYLWPLWPYTSRSSRGTRRGAQTPTPHILRIRGRPRGFHLRYFAGGRRQRRPRRKLKGVVWFLNSFCVFLDLVGYGRKSVLRSGQPPTLSPEVSDAAASAAHAPYTRLCAAEAAEASRALARHRVARVQTTV